MASLNLLPANITILSTPSRQAGGQKLPRPFPRPPFRSASEGPCGPRSSCPQPYNQTPFRRSSRKTPAFFSAPLLPGGASSNAVRSWSEGYGAGRTSAGSEVVLCVGYTGGVECQRGRTAILPADLSQHRGKITQVKLAEEIVRCRLDIGRV